MTRILYIDDETINHQIFARALEPLGCHIDFSETGLSGVAMARTLNPDVIVTDVMMPELNGYEVTKLLRREKQFAATPILILTAQSGLQDKLKAFEAGADDYLTKPFEAQELAARVTALSRRFEAARAAGSQPEAPKEEGTMIAVQSLRGGTGSSTLAINLGVGLASLWPHSTILLDLTMTAGQIALMLNKSLRRTWADIAHYKPEELDWEMLNSVVNDHDSGLAFIAAPTFPSDSENLSGDTLTRALQLLKKQYSYIIADLPHDFSDVPLRALDEADIILMIASPDMASIRAATAALDTYEKIGYPKEKIKLVLNATFPRAGLPKDKIETALGMTAVVTIPYVQDIFVEAINLGRPPVFHKPQEPVSSLLEDFAFFMSRDVDKKTKPQNPTEAWTRVYKRYMQRHK
jgi:pilus assembly protein CpaE